MIIKLRIFEMLLHPKHNKSVKGYLTLKKANRYPRKIVKSSLI